MNRRRVCAIIPAYNEQATIESVVRIVRASPCVDELVVVSDGSTDETAARARKTGAVVYELSPNRGKAQAMRFAVEQTDAEILLFLDADLIGLTQTHVEQLLYPVLDGSVGMNVGIRDRGVFFTWLCHFFPLIGGERALVRSVFEQVPNELMRGYMIEPAMNASCRAQKFNCGTVDLRGLTLRRKYEKVGWPKAVVQYGWMTFQIIWSLVRVRISHYVSRFIKN